MLSFDQPFVPCEMNRSVAGKESAWLGEEESEAMNFLNQSGNKKREVITVEYLVFPLSDVFFR